MERTTVLLPFRIKKKTENDPTAKMNWGEYAKAY